MEYRMDNQIISTGNTLEDATDALQFKVAAVKEQEPSAVFDEPAVYGNSEMGFKIVQYYKVLPL
jgi:hypothetical protein